MLLVVLIANRDLSSLRQEPPRRWREGSLQDFEDLAIHSVWIGLKRKLRGRRGLDTVILVWGARLVTPLMFLACASSLLEDHLILLGESWSIALQLSLMLAGCVFAYFAMPAPVRSKHQIRNILLTVVSITLVIGLGLWNLMGVSIHFAKVSFVEASTVKWEQYKAIAPLP